MVSPVADSARDVQDGLSCMRATCAAMTASRLSLLALDDEAHAAGDMAADDGDLCGGDGCGDTLALDA